MMIILKEGRPVFLFKPILEVIIHGIEIFVLNNSVSTRLWITGDRDLFLTSWDS